MTLWNLWIASIDHFDLVKLSVCHKLPKFELNSDLLILSDRLTTRGQCRTCKTSGVNHLYIEWEHQTLWEMFRKRNKFSIFWAPQIWDVCKFLLFSPLAGHDVGVGDGVSHGDVAIHRDDHQVEDARGAGPHVHWEPHEAKMLPEYPAVHHLLRMFEVIILFARNSGLMSTQNPATSYTADRGRTRTPRRRSATARLTMMV